MSKTITPLNSSVNNSSRGTLNQFILSSVRRLPIHAHVKDTFISHSYTSQRGHCIYIFVHCVLRTPCLTMTVLWMGRKSFSLSHPCLFPLSGERKENRALLLTVHNCSFIVTSDSYLPSVTSFCDTALEEVR